MAQISQQSPQATPGVVYSFSAKPAAGAPTHPVSELTSLGLNGVMWVKYSFSAKPAASILDKDWWYTHFVLGH